MNRNIFNELLHGMEELKQFQEGKITLKTTTLKMPPPVAVSPDEIRAIREKLNMSQAVFAGRLRMSVRTLQGWESGRTRPNPQAALLLKMVAHSPQNFETIATL